MKHAIMIAASFASLAIAGCHSQHERPSPQGLGSPLSVTRQKLMDAAGAQAIDCGHVEVREDRSKINQCIDRAVREHSAFIARYEMQGIDSRVMEGIAQNGKGEFFRLVYGSDPAGGGRDPNLISESRVQVSKCDKAPERDVDGTLTCQ